MTKKLHMSESLALPLDAVVQKFAFIARSGAGKTYGASLLAEQMLGAGAQVIVLDPVGVWWGLRLDADGKKKGISIPVFGGEHGDIPLEPHAGALVADLVVDKGISIILDVSGFTQGEAKRFLTDFAERFVHRKKASRTPVHLFLEEAQTFVPQRVQKGEERLLGAFERIGKLGRNWGIGLTLISQRPQAVHKDVLNQTEALFVGQVNGAQERKALKAWIVEQSGDQKLVDALPGLPIGTMYLWSPQWLQTFEKVKIATKRTFNASATPVFGGKKAAPRGELAPVDLDAIRVAMKETIERSKADDPKALRARVAELEKALKAASSAKAPAPAKEKRVEVPVLTEKDHQRLHAKVESLDARLDRARAQFVKDMEPVHAVLQSIREKIGPAWSPVPPAAARALVAPTRSAAAAPRPASRNQLARTGALPRGADSPLGKGERVVLVAIAQHEAGVTDEQISVLTGYKRTSRITYVGKLTGQGLAARRDDGVLVATPAGLAALGPDFERLPTGDALREYWRGRLPAGELAVFDVLVEQYPDSVDDAAIDEVTGYKRTSRITYLGKLKTRKLVEKSGTGHVASAGLFDGGR